MLNSAHFIQFAFYSSAIELTLCLSFCSLLLQHFHIDFVLIFLQLCLESEIWVPSNETHVFSPLSMLFDIYLHFSGEFENEVCSSGLKNPQHTWNSPKSNWMCNMASKVVLVHTDCIMQRFDSGCCHGIFSGLNGTTIRAQHRAHSKSAHNTFIMRFFRRSHPLRECFGLSLAFTTCRWHYQKLAMSKMTIKINLELNSVFLVRARSRIHEHKPNAMMPLCELEKHFRATMNTKMRSKICLKMCSGSHEASIFFCARIIHFGSFIHSFVFFFFFFLLLSLSHSFAWFPANMPEMDPKRVSVERTSEKKSQNKLNEQRKK